MDGRVYARWLGKRKKGRSLGWERPFARETPHLHLRGDYYSILIGMHEMGCAGEKRMVMQYSRDRGGERGSHTFRDASVTVLEFVSRYVDLKPTASGAVGLCPFHDDHHPSFGVNTESNYWHCFAGCGGGSVIDFWMGWKKCDFTTAVKELAEIWTFCVCTMTIRTWAQYRVCFAALTPRLARLRVDEVNLIFTQLRQQSVVENHGGSKSG
jgi:hypothetical protein